MLYSDRYSVSSKLRADVFFLLKATETKVKTLRRRSSLFFICYVGDRSLLRVKTSSLLFKMIYCFRDLILTIILVRTVVENLNFFLSKENLLLS